MSPDSALRVSARVTVTRVATGADGDEPAGAQTRGSAGSWRRRGRGAHNQRTCTRVHRGGAGPRVGVQKAPAGPPSTPLTANNQRGQKSLTFTVNTRQRHGPHRPRGVVTMDTESALNALSALEIAALDQLNSPNAWFTESMHILNRQMGDLNLQLNDATNPPSTSARKNINRTLKKKIKWRAAMRSGEAAAAAKKQGAAVMRVAALGRQDDWGEFHGLQSETRIVCPDSIAPLPSGDLLIADHDARLKVLLHQLGPASKSMRDAGPDRCIVTLAALGAKAGSTQFGSLCGLSVCSDGDSCLLTQHGELQMVTGLLAALHMWPTVSPLPGMYEQAHRATHRLPITGMCLAHRAITTGTGTGTGTAATDWGATGSPRTATDGPGRCVVARSSSISTVAHTGQVSTLCGDQAQGEGGWFADGAAAAATFSCISDIARLPDGSGYVVADRSNHKLRHVTPEGVVTTLAGSGEPHARGTGAGTGTRTGSGTGSMDGPLATATLPYPQGVAVDVRGRIVVTCEGQLRVVDRAAGQVRTLRVVDVHGGAARCVGKPAIDGDGNIWLADGNIFHLTNTGLSPGFHAWSETCWFPTAECRQRCTPRAREAVRTVLLAVVRCRSGQNAAGKLPLDTWYLILSKIRLWELGKHW